MGVYLLIAFVALVVLIWLYLATRSLRFMLYVRWLAREAAMRQRRELFKIEG